MYENVVADFQNVSRDICIKLQAPVLRKKIVPYHPASVMFQHARDTKYRTT